MIQSPFRLLQTRIKNRMAFTQIEWILAIRNQSLAICVPQDVCTSDISRHVQNAICFYKCKHVCSHVYSFLCYLFLRIFAATFLLSSHWLQTWNNVFDQFFTQIAITKYLNYDLPFLPFSDPSRFPTSGPRARRHKFKTNTIDSIYKQIKISSLWISVTVHRKTDHAMPANTSEKRCDPTGAWR